MERVLLDWGVTKEELLKDIPTARFHDGNLHIQILGCEFILSPDGKWAINDTTGG